MTITELNNGSDNIDNIRLLQAQIAVLLEKIAEFQKELLKIQGHVFDKPLFIGQTSEKVEHLQQFLKGQGQDVYPEGLTTGYFGSLTEKAVQRFQFKYGIVDSEQDSGYGYVGPKTRAKINEMLE